MRTGKIFFGGTFDPVHKGHIALAEYVQEHFPSCTLLFAPAFFPPHKNPAGLSSFEHRMAMVKKALAGKRNVEVSDVESKREGRSYSFDTLHILKEKYPGEEIFLLIGGDSLLQLHFWYRARDLVRDFPILVYPRPGENITVETLMENSWTREEGEKLSSAILGGNVPQFPVSSTMIRALYAAGKREEAEQYVPESVAEYIRKHFLYPPA